MSITTTTEELLDAETIKKIKQFEKDNPDKTIQISNVEEVDNTPDWQLKTVECRECGKVFIGSFNKLDKWVSPWKKLAGHVISSDDHIRSKRWATKYLQERKW